MRPWRSDMTMAVCERYPDTVEVWRSSRHGPTTVFKNLCATECGPGCRLSNHSIWLRCQCSAFGKPAPRRNTQRRARLMYSAERRCTDNREKVREIFLGLADLPAKRKRSQAGANRSNSFFGTSRIRVAHIASSPLNQDLCFGILASAQEPASFSSDFSGPYLNPIRFVVVTCSCPPNQTRGRPAKNVHSAGKKL